MNREERAAIDELTDEEAEYSLTLSPQEYDEWIALRIATRTYGQAILGGASR